MDFGRGRKTAGRFQIRVVDESRIQQWGYPIEIITINENIVLSGASIALCRHWHGGRRRGEEKRVTRFNNNCCFLRVSFVRRDEAMFLVVPPASRSALQTLSAPGIKARCPVDDYVGRFEWHAAKTQNAIAVFNRRKNYIYSLFHKNIYHEISTLIRPGSNDVVMIRTENLWVDRRWNQRRTEYGGKCRAISCILKYKCNRCNNAKEKITRHTRKKRNERWNMINVRTSTRVEKDHWEDPKQDIRL